MNSVKNKHCTCHFRSRWQGEVSQGPIGLNQTGVDPKTVFYMKKVLNRYDLLRSQVLLYRFIHELTCKCNSVPCDTKRFNSDSRWSLCFIPRSGRTVAFQYNVVGEGSGVLYSYWYSYMNNTFSACVYNLV